jgi:tetratricopeptide (TPR) repeat protein
MYKSRGDAYISKKDYYCAIADFNQAGRLDPDNALAYYFCEALYSDMKNHADAIQDYEKIRRLDPNWQYLVRNQF